MTVLSTSTVDVTTSMTGNDVESSGSLTVIVDVILHSIHVAGARASSSVDVDVLV